MGNTGNSLIRWIEVQQEIIDTPDTFHMRSWVVALFSLAFKNRLELQVAFILSRELNDRAQECMKHAKKLAEDIAELGGAQTADPTGFVMLSPWERFSIPSSNSSVSSFIES